jgi:hypothetical protein
MQDVIFRVLGHTTCCGTCRVHHNQQVWCRWPGARGFAESSLDVFT